MPQFKRVFSHLLRLHPKSRQLSRPRAVGIPTANTKVAWREAKCLRRRAHLVPDPVAQDVQSSTETLVEGIDESESESEDEDELHKIDVVVAIQDAEPLTDSILDKVDEVDEYEYEDDDSYPSDRDDESADEEDEVIPEVFPYDLAQKTRHEMITQRLYVAASDNDREIAALRTVHREKFTHIVRVAFDTLPRHDNITPSSWTTEEIYPDVGPQELRLTCPALALHYSDKLAALWEKQLLTARDYITRALPDRNEPWAAQGLRSLLSSDECEDTRVLVVGPQDRSVDVMAIVVCYLASVTGTRADYLLDRLQRLTPVHSHWGSGILSEDCLEMVNEVSKQALKW